VRPPGVVEQSVVAGDLQRDAETATNVALCQLDVLEPEVPLLLCRPVLVVDVCGRPLKTVADLALTHALADQPLDDVARLSADVEHAEV
jgi:hypothetical protein